MTVYYIEFTHNGREGATTVNVADAAELQTFVRELTAGGATVTKTVEETTRPMLLEKLSAAALEALAVAQRSAPEAPTVYARHGMRPEPDVAMRAPDMAPTVAALTLAIDACPRCGSHNISGGAFDVDAGTCSQKIFCSECEHEWADVYTLSGQVTL